jgi:hypothetical protein
MAQAAVELALETQKKNHQILACFFALEKNLRTCPYEVAV